MSYIEKISCVNWRFRSFVQYISILINQTLLRLAIFDLICAVVSFLQTFILFFFVNSVDLDHMTSDNQISKNHTFQTLGGGSVVVGSL